MGSGLESCLFREKLTTIGDDAFRDCADFERFRFHYTSVTSIGSGVFAGSGLECLDLRKVTSIHPDAFTGSALTIQIVGTEQEATVIGVDRLYFDGAADLYESAHCLNGTLTFNLDHAEFLRVTDEDGNPVDLTVTGKPYDCNFSFMPVEGTDYHLNQSKAVVRYPDGLGLDETVVELEPGTTSFELTEPTLGDLEFDHWEIEGLEGEYTQIDWDTLVSTGGDVTLVPVFGNAVLTLDHSGISAFADTSELETQVLFTFGSSYPELPDLVGYGFAEAPTLNCRTLSGTGSRDGPWGTGATPPATGSRRSPPTPRSASGSRQHSALCPTSGRTGRLSPPRSTRTTSPPTSTRPS